MHLSLRSNLYLLALAAVASGAGGACGGNVIVDGSGGKTTTSSSSSSSTTTTGSTSSSTSTTGSSSTSTTSSSSTSTTSSSGGACTDAFDMGILANQVIWPAEVNCAVQNPLNLGGTQMCVQAATGVTAGCAGCIAQDLLCAEQDCLNICQSAPNGQACAQCRQVSCGAAFTACSGLSRETGSTSCAALFGNGPTVTPWIQGLPAAYFTTDNAYAAYQKYSACACSACPPCQMDYCTGTLPASNNCDNCTQANCGTAVISFCQSN